MSTRLFEVEALTACPLCNEAKAELVYTHPDLYIPILHLYRCRACQTIYLNPRLTLAAIVQVEAQSAVYDFSSAIAEEEIKASMGLIRWLETYQRTRTRCLLDIGCNRGLLLEAARRQGWQVIGVEISPESANRARNDFGLTVYPKITDIDPSQQFDLITAWHVLEHTREPLLFLQQAVARLRPGGILAIQVPSFDYLDEFRKREQLSSLICAVHNFYFTSMNLRMLLEKVGIHIIQLDNDPDAHFLTAIVRKPLTTANRLGKAWQLLKSGEWGTLAREARSYWQWRLTKSV